MTREIIRPHGSRKSLPRYHILEKIGRGGMSIVYKARDTRLKRFVALKFLPEGACEDGEACERLQEEARIASALNHPNICTVFDIDESSVGPFIVMEFMDGQTLRQTLSERYLTLKETLSYGMQIADALTTTHANGVVHRDVSPSNLFITRNGRVKLIDFGLATDALKTSSLQPGPGTVTGTLSYMSPEQAQSGVVDNRSDIFSAGVVLYEMLAHQRPFRGDTMADTIRQILSAKPPSLRQINPLIPAALEKAVNKCLEKRVDHRYQTAEELRLALSKVYCHGLPAGGAVPMRSALETSSSLDHSTVRICDITRLSIFGS
jgi:serine/threonine protein kinase